MTGRMRVLVLVAATVVLLGSAGGYVGYLRQRADAAPAGSAGTLDPAGVLSKPRLVFRSTALGGDYGRVGVVPLADPGGPRAVLDVSCERVYATRTAGVCVTAKRGVAPTYAVGLLDTNLRPTTSVPLAGLPSRARMSRDGTLVATTTFVTGHSYAQASFSTSTIVRRGLDAPLDLESFAAYMDGHRLRAVDRNFWGVTFTADGDTFYASAASGGRTWLVRGSLASRRLDSVHTDAECPSLSPDGTQVAYKKRLGQRAGVWRLAVLDLADGRERLLAETRTVDDQVEWLDRDRLLYARSREGAEGTVSDIWQVSADGTGTPSVLVAQASSPAVVR